MSRYIRMIYRGKTLTGHLEGFHLTTNQAFLHFGNLTGYREVNFNTGYGCAGFSDWRVHPEDLEPLREAAVEAGKQVKPCGKSTGRPKKPKGPQPVHPKQLSFADFLDNKDAAE